jgi:catalase (peroxidase I)
MPTTRPRYQLTVTEDVQEALERAAERWPQDAGRPGRLLLRLVHAGDETLRDERGRARERRRRAIEETAGRFTGMWPRDAIKKLHDEWPA